MPEQDSVIGVWYVGPQGLFMGSALAGIPAVVAVVRWFALAIHPDLDHLSSAAVVTAIALGCGVFSWWNVLRVRLELRADVITLVNPWGTQRLPWTDVRALTRGSWGAQFHTAEGFKYTAYALSDLAGGGRQDKRFAELQGIVDAQLRNRPPL